MTFTCAICGKTGEGTPVNMGDLGIMHDAPRGWWSRTTARHGRQAACSWEHARELMARDLQPVST